MPIRKAEAEWSGTLREGHGALRTESGYCGGKYSYESRFGGGSGGTNPEELIGAAHAACFSMMLAGLLEREGFNPERIHTAAKVSVEQEGTGHRITRIQLETAVSVQGMDSETLGRIAEESKSNCPVSKALTGMEIGLHVRLLEPVGSTEE